MRMYDTRIGLITVTFPSSDVNLRLGNFAMMSRLRNRLFTLICYEFILQDYYFILILFLLYFLTKFESNAINKLN